MNTIQEQISNNTVTYFNNHVIGGYPDHGSYRSWEHCFNFFDTQDIVDYDLAALHLGFYLASWGMYRGSAAIRNYDYKIHTPAVRIIFESGISRVFEADSYSIELTESVYLLYEQLSHYYEDKVGALETLITKILLGTLGCAPAYDRYLRVGLSKIQLPMSFSKKNFKSVVRFCKENDGITDAQNKLRNKGYKYPIMRVFDIYCHSLARL